MHRGENELREAKRRKMVEALIERDGCALIRKSPSLYWSRDHCVRAAFSVSKRHPNELLPYWYAYHAKQEKFMGEGDHGYVVLGCLDTDTIFAIPKEIFHSFLPYLNKTKKNASSYWWQIHLMECSSGEFRLRLRGRGQSHSLSPYCLLL